MVPGWRDAYWQMLMDGQDMEKSKHWQGFDRADVAIPMRQANLSLCGRSGSRAEVGAGGDGKTRRR